MEDKITGGKFCFPFLNYLVRGMTFPPSSVKIYHLQDILYVFNKLLFIVPKMPCLKGSSGLEACAVVHKMDKSFHLLRLAPALFIPLLLLLSAEP